MNMEAYRNMNDAAERHGLPELAEGRTEIYYMRMGDTLGGERLSILASFGVAGLTRHKPGDGFHSWHPTVAQFQKHWTQIGKIACRDREVIFGVMQGEIWSPNGEARNLIRRIGMDHTSMSVGDMVCIDGVYHICRCDGWEKWDEG